MVPSITFEARLGTDTQIKERDWKEVSKCQDLPGLQVFGSPWSGSRMTGEGLGAKAQVCEVGGRFQGSGSMPSSGWGVFPSELHRTPRGPEPLSPLYWMSNPRLRELGYLKSEFESQPLESKLGLVTTEHLIAHLGQSIFTKAHPWWPLEPTSGRGGWFTN